MQLLQSMTNMPFFDHPFWGFTILGNSMYDYTLTLVLFGALSLVFMVFQKILLHRLEILAQKTSTDADDAIVIIIRSVRPPFYSFLAFYIAIQSLTLPDFLTTAVGIALLVWLVYQITVAIQLFVNFIVEKRTIGEGVEDDAEGALKFLGTLVKIAVWVSGGLFILSNAGVNITSLIAGLGIGGIAIAFALQNILSDLFSSFAIFFDKPFKPGDFIVTKDHMGTVKKIGIKTTRIKALQGEEIIISNQELTSARVQNFKRMEERRIIFGFGVTYQTPAEKMRKIPETVQKIIENIENTRFDRCHFNTFNDSALGFEVVYHVTSPEYNTYMDVQQTINLAIKEAFEKDKIDMAYPTQTIYLAKTAKID